MSEGQPKPPPTANELREARKEERREAGRRAVRWLRTKKLLRRSVLVVIATTAVGFAVWYVMSRTAAPGGDVISRRGLHWHSQLAIMVRGERQNIPANIGVGAVHNPIHTHGEENTVHMEMQGLVTRDDIRLGEFFKVWGKPFNPTCILDVCNGQDGTLRMMVNGSVSTEFDAYVMRDNDKIELIYE